MKEFITDKSNVAAPKPNRTARLKTYSYIGMVFLTGCTATVVRWDAVRMREEIMAFYNDEIMDNLIRMREGLPFVHVDISSVSAAAVSQISGTVGGGDTRSFSRPGPLGTIGSISRSVMRPFSYSVTPLHTENLTMSAVPVIGQLAADNSGDQSTTLAATESAAPASTATPTPAPKTTTIYAIYERFRFSIAENRNVLVRSEFRPGQDEFVPGTLKRHGLRYYYIRDDAGGINRREYFNLCKSLFTQTRGKPSGKTLEATSTDVQVIKAQGALLQSQPPR